MGYVHSISQRCSVRYLPFLYFEILFFTFSFGESNAQSRGPPFLMSLQSVVYLWSIRSIIDEDPWFKLVKGFTTPFTTECIFGWLWKYGCWKIGYFLLLVQQIAKKYKFILLRCWVHKSKMSLMGLKVTYQEDWSLSLPVPTSQDSQHPWQTSHFK
jgi:hypothetical protein